MIATLEQKRGLEYRKHTLKGDKIVVETKTAIKTTRYEVALENLRFDLQYQSDNKIGSRITAGILLIIPALLTFVFLTSASVKSPDVYPFLSCMWGVIAFIFLLGIIRRPQDDIFLTGGKTNLVLFRTAPNEVVVMTFINQVHETVKTYLRDKYLCGEFSNEEDYYRSLQWLLSEKVISPVEAKRYKETFQPQLKDIYRPSLN